MFIILSQVLRLREYERNSYPEFAQPVQPEELRIARLILTRRNFLAAFSSRTNLKFPSRTERVHLKRGKLVCEVARDLYSLAKCNRDSQQQVELSSLQRAEALLPHFACVKRLVFWNTSNSNRSYIRFAKRKSNICDSRKKHFAYADAFQVS